jgi:hypothetical protein
VNKVNLAFLTFVIFSTLFCNNASAQGSDPACSDQTDGYNGTCTATASNYEMTMKSMRLRKDDGSFVTIASGDATYNFASVSAGASVGSYITSGTIPPGTYTAISPILDKDITVAGSVTLSGGGTPTCRTGTGDITDGGAAQDEIFDMSSSPGISSGTDAVEGQSDGQYMNGDNDFVIIDSTVTGFPITVGEGTSLTFTMTIGIGASATYDWSGGGGSTCTDSYPGELDVQLAATGA